jgi:methionyl-tRNA synthetase
MNTSIPSLTHYVTTPIYYVNGDPHLGHAYTSIAADVTARWKRQRGYDVFFLTGTDEHGQKVEQAAAKHSLAPQAFVDNVSARFVAMNTALHISNDYFIRTTNTAHKDLCRMIWADLEKKDFIYLGKYHGWYSTRDECYYSANEVIQSVDGTCSSIDTGAEVIWIEETNYFFRLTMFKDDIKDHILANPDFVDPIGARNEVLALIDSVEDVCVSRTSFSWGIPVPEHDGHVMYVWIDALMNYITALAINDKMNFWPANLHLIGKEITRFHAIIWPAMLMALEYPLPKRIYAHGWWTANGKKMGKSTGNVIDPFDCIEKYGVDRLRYYVLREMPFGHDGDFSDKSMITRTNADLSNDLGNLAQRTLSLTFKRESAPRYWPELETSAECNLINNAKRLEAVVDRAIDRQAFHEALDAVWAVVRDGNAYISTQQPWREADDKRAETILQTLVLALTEVAKILTPFMPESMAILTAQLKNPLVAPTPIFPRL